MPKEAAKNSSNGGKDYAEGKVKKLNWEKSRDALRLQLLWKLLPPYFSVPARGFGYLGIWGLFLFRYMVFWCHIMGIKYLFSYKNFLWYLDMSFHMWMYVDTEFEICSPNVCQAGKGGNKKSLWQTALHQNWVRYLSVTTWKNHF